MEFPNLKNVMKDKIILTICERHRENTEKIRITGRTEEGKEYTFHLLGENAWWFESFLKKETQITICPIETYVIYAETLEEPIRIPPENLLCVRGEERHSKSICDRNAIVLPVCTLPTS